MSEEILNDCLDDKLKTTSSYNSPLRIPDELRKFTERREQRAEELGIALYVLETDTRSDYEFQKLEDYIMENFIDLDLDVPEDIKKKYLEMKKDRENSYNN
jgi:hypothetical protein